MFRSVLALALAGTALAAATANEFRPRLEALAEREIRAILSDPALIEAVRAQNARNAGLGRAEIESLDGEWRAQVGAAEAPLIRAVTDSPLAEALRRRQAASAGLYSEIFVMDAVGLNVAASDATSDYWQGDEAKWQQSYGAGPKAMHVGEIEFDESAQAYLSQISVAIADPETGQPIGAATFGVNVEMLN